MKPSEKSDLEQVYDLIYEDDPESAVALLKKFLVRKELSRDFEEIIYFKIADILFQQNKFRESKGDFEVFLKEFPNSKLKENAEERLKYIIKLKD